MISAVIGLALHAAALSTRADTVLVSELPLGSVEVVGSAVSGAHVLRLGPNSTTPAWSDSRGNTFLSYNSPMQIQGIQVVQANKVRYPAADLKTEIKTVSGQEVDAVSSAADGFKLTYTVTPQRLGIRIDGADGCTLQLRYVSAIEGCRVQAGDKVRFLTGGIGALEGGPQLVIDSRRTRAMGVTPPVGAAITWGLDPGISATQLPFLLGSIALKPGQTVWLSDEPIPAYTGPVEMGLFNRYYFHAGTAPVATATLSSAQIQPGQPVTLTFKQPIDKTLKGGTVVAALMPLSPADPAAAAEAGMWWVIFDPVTAALMPLQVNQTGDTVSIAAPATTPKGAYRMRVWVVPHDHPLPEVLGGPKGGMVAYFPGVVRDPNLDQPWPTGDVIVAVHGASHGSLAVVDPEQRQNFWRGETVRLLVQAHSTEATLSPKVTVSGGAPPRAIGSYPLKLTLIDGYGSAELALPTGKLAPGDYRVVTEAAGLESYEYSFTIAPPREPGMAFVNSPLSGPSGVKMFERLGLNVWTDVMPSTNGHSPAWPDPMAATRGLSSSDPAAPLAAASGDGEYEQLVRGNWLWLQGIQSRQIDFYLHHTIPEHVEETLRKHLVYAQMNQRFPSMLGLVFDYDLIGVVGAGSWGPGWETFEAAGKKRTAMLTELWNSYWKEAQAQGATAAEAGRFHALFNARVIENIYARSIKSLHDYLPEQRHTTSSTLDHATLADGLYAPSIYRPLDFRYIEVWNDQVYPCSAHDMQESFWTSILRMEMPAGEPLWSTVPIAAQPGTHLRRALATIGRGATGVGYDVEGGAGLNGGVWGADPAASNIRTAEVNLSADMVNHYGAFLNQFAPNEKIAILYSVSQGGWNFGENNPVFYAYYTLAQMNRPAQLLTEDQMANGALSSMEALVIVRQTATLPPTTLNAIEQFAASGGKVLCDRDTTLPVKGMQKLAEVSYPGSLWPCCTNEFHEMIAKMAGIATPRALQAAARTISYFNPNSIPANMPAALRTALGDAGRQPLEPVHGRALVLNKVAGSSTLVMVTNENTDPLEGLFTDAELKTRFYRNFLEFGWVYYKDLRVPQAVTLRLRDDLAANPPHVYDVFAGRELEWQKNDKDGLTVTVDLATLQGRALLLTPKAIERPTILVGKRSKSDPLATVVVRSDVPLPVHIRVGKQEVFRASNAAGSSDTFALGPQPQTVDVDVTELISGKTRRGSLSLGSGTEVKLQELPAVDVIDPVHVRRALAAKNLAIYVDPRQTGQLQAAEHLAAKIPGSQVVFNPAVVDYVLDWDLPADTEAVNQKIRDQATLAWRRPIRPYFQWVGPLTPAAVWSRPAIVFGNAGDNRLIADLNTATVLRRPATPETIGAGRAVIGVAAAPFWNDQDVIYALTQDDTGTAAALDQLASLATQQASVSDVAVTDDDTPQAERRRQLGFEPLRYPDKLAKLHTESVDAPKPSLAPCIPVAGLVLDHGGVLVALGTPGRNLVQLDANGHETWRSMTAAFYQPVELRANAAGESAARDDSFVWRHDAVGKPLWKILGTLAAPLADDGSAWITVDNSVRHVSATGDILQSVDLPGKVLALSHDCSTAIIQKPGVGAGMVRIEAAVVAVDMASRKELWKVDECEAIEAVLSDDGKTLSVVENENLIRRDDIATSKMSRLTVIDVATGKVRLRASMGRQITNMIFSPDGHTVMAREAGYSDTVFFADLNTGLLRQLRLPEAGGWAHAFSLDGKSLWIACEKLYRIDVETLATHTDLTGHRIVQLAATGDGLVAGTADGHVLWLGGKGDVKRDVNVGSGIEVADMLGELATLRDARLVDSPSLRPHEVPDTVNLAYEYPRCWAGQYDFRGDGICPPHFAVHIATAGKYRFTIPLYNAKTDVGNLGVLKLMVEDGTVGIMQPTNGDKFVQSAVIELKPGVYDIYLGVADWKTQISLKEMKIEKVE